MRVVSWNLAGGSVPPASNAKQQEAWAYIRDLSPDVILAQEARASALPRWLKEEWTLVSGEKGRFRKTWAWGSVIAARQDLNLRPHPEALDDPGFSWAFGHLYDLTLVGVIDLPEAGPTAVASVHTPAMAVRDWVREYRLRDYPAIPFPLTDEELVTLQRPCGARPFYNDFAFTAFEHLFRGGSFFVAGDWNTSRRFLPAGPESFSGAEERGWVECHSEPEEQSYFKKSVGAYQLDHAFCDQLTAASVRSCHVVVDEIVLALSDHAPLMTDLASAV